MTQNLTLINGTKRNNDFLSCLKDIFEGQEFRFITHSNGDAWFVAKDICNILEIRNSRDAVSRLDDDEKQMSVIPTPGQNRKVTLINESGLYSLIFTSNKNKAKRFKKFITSKVIPEIRQTGSYNAKQQSRIEEIKALFIREMPSKWEKLFPLELFELFSDLKGWSYRKGISSYTNAMKYLINKYIYGVLPSEVMDIIYQENTGRSTKLHQWLTDEIAREIVKTQITKVMTLLRVSNNWNTFEKLFDQCNYGQKTLLTADQL